MAGGEEVDHQQTRRDFDAAVNMTAAQLRKWLEGEESKSVGQRSGDDAESTGHATGRHIVQILDAKVSGLTDADYSHMRKVVGYVKRHLAQRPPGDVEDTAWRFSMMNWDHDPTQEK